MYPGSDWTGASSPDTIKTPKTNRVLRKPKENEMTDEKCPSTKDRREGRGMRTAGVQDGLYGLAFIGAAVYFIQQATTFGAGVIGFLKALVWPAFLVYKLLEFLKM
jgi:hypothetical protein